MIKNFFVFAFRNLTKNKGYTTLNILGLAAGLTCFAFIGVWVHNELSYDRFNKNADRIFRIAGTVITEAESFSHACSSVPMAAALKADFPEIQQTVRFDRSDAIVKLGDKQFSEEGIVAADPSFFDVFSYSLNAGNVATALNAPFNIVLTESVAKKYFGAENPIGKTLTLLLYDTSGKGTTYNITGLMPDAPKNAHITFNFLVSFKSLESYDAELTTPDGWGNNSFYTYLLLKDKSDNKKVQAGLPAFYKRHIARPNDPGKNRVDLFLQPLTDIHLQSHLRYEVEPNGDTSYLYIFITVALFILLIAAINYMNLATAGSLKRAKEVGVKKVLGATKKQLVGQHLTEAVMVALISFVISLLLSTLLKPLFVQLSGKELSVFDSWLFPVILFGVTVIIGLVSGLYPAFFITSYKAADVLKGSFKSKAGGVFLRKGLVVLQFSIAVVLIAGILVVDSQMKFIRHKDLGFKKDALVALKVNGAAEVEQNYEAFKNSLLSNPLIKGMTTSRNLIIGGLGNAGATTIDGKGNPLHTSTYRLRVDADYLNVYGMKLASGRNFYKDYPGDTVSCVVNEATVKAFGWGSNEAAINKPFRMGRTEGKVIGVVKDFHFHTMQHPIEPLAIVLTRQGIGQITLKIEMKEPAKAIAAITDTWKKFFPGSLLQYDFIDDKLNDQYKAEEKFSGFFVYFSLLSLLIAALGLFGLTAYSTQQRVKEVGIRKVMGASIVNIASMLSKDFLKLVLLAAIIGFPVAWFIMHKWLQDFAYRVDISWWMLAAAGIVALVIALLTVSFQAIKAAIANPIKSLRTE